MMNKETIKKIDWKNKKTWIGIFIIIGILLVLTPQKSLGYTSGWTELNKISNTSVNIIKENSLLHSAKNIGNKTTIVYIHCDSKMTFCLNDYCNTGNEEVFTDNLNFSIKSNEEFKFLPLGPYEKDVKCNISINDKQAYILYARGPRGGLQYDSSPDTFTGLHDYLSPILILSVFVTIIVGVLVIVFVLIKRRRKSKDKRK